MQGDLPRPLPLLCHFPPKATREFDLKDHIAQLRLLLWQCIMYSRFWHEGDWWILALLVLNYNIGFVLPQGRGCEGEDRVLARYMK